MTTPIPNPGPATLAERLLDALPQTQCTRCGYPDCAAYAQALAEGAAAINQCPPGGAEGVQRLAALTGQPALPLNPANGAEGPRQVAWIDEAWCIGCTLCIAACPVDCIVGAPKRMHTVIEADCTGCELCVPACPVDCIHLDNVTGERTGWAAWSSGQAQAARAQYQATQARRQRQADEQVQRREEKTSGATANSPETPETPEAPTKSAADPKRAAIAAALARARQQRTMP